jgi:hypothetical protein
MKRLAFGAAAAGGAVFALHRLAPKVREIHAHCREMTRTHCGNASARRQPPGALA